MANHWLYFLLLVNIITTITRVLNVEASSLSSSNQGQNVNDPSSSESYAVLEDQFGRSSGENNSNVLTTERPLINYWKNLLGKLRLPLPGINWSQANNPITNILSKGAAVIETPVTNSGLVKAVNSKSSTEKQGIKKYNKVKNLNGGPVYLTNGHFYFFDPYTFHYYVVFKGTIPSTTKSSNTFNKEHVPKPVKPLNIKSEQYKQMLKQETKKKPYQNLQIHQTDESVSVVENFEDDDESWRKLNSEKPHHHKNAY